MAKTRQKYVRQYLREGRAGTVAEWYIEDHGVDHAQYFRGCGLAHTHWDDVAVGAGYSPREAYEDAVMQLASSGWDTFEMPSGKGFSNRSEVPEVGEDELSELYHYVCVYVRGIPPAR